MIVMKFGGTSVQDADAIRRLVEIVRSRLDKKPVVVSSATSGTTDALLKACDTAATRDFNQADSIINEIHKKHIQLSNELVSDITLLKELTEKIERLISELKDLIKGIYLLSEIPDRIKAKVVSYGEMLSTPIISCSLIENGIKSTLVDSREFIITNSIYLKGEPDYSEINKRTQQILLPVIKNNSVPVAQGFIANTVKGEPSVLGRGGSDYTASLIGMAMNAEEVEIWTDVDGMMTADPRKVTGTKIIDEISFKEAAELAFFGAKVLHPSTIIPAVENNIPVRILNSKSPSKTGTLIKEEIEKSGAAIKSITSKEEIKVLNIYSPKMLFAHGFLKKIFDVFDKYKTSVDLITTSEVNVSLTLDNDEMLGEIINELSQFSEVELDGDRSLVCVVGENLKFTKGIAKKIFSVMEQHNIYMISQGASVINFSFVIDRVHLKEILQSLHDEFFGK